MPLPLKLPQDDHFMRRALALARRGMNVSPNPQVGCVIIRHGRVVAEGWHARFGGPHAESAALARAGGRARGAAVYVNLEPCCHADKKTPPCVDALVKAGVRRVVVGAIDPNPKVSGRGIKRLRGHGIAVTTGILERECRMLNRPFQVRMTQRRPYVILKAAASLDGRIETAGGESKWITSPGARQAARRMRGHVDAILVGAGTVLADDPSLTAHGLGRDPLRIVLDPTLRVPRRAKVFDGSAPALVVTSRSDFSPIKGLKAKDAVILQLAARGSLARTRERQHGQQNVNRRNGGRAMDRIDLRELLSLLYELGVASILVEGGSAVHTSFLEAGLVDEVRLFLAPKLIGGAEARGFFEGNGIRRLADALKVADLGVRRIGPDILITGQIG